MGVSITCRKTGRTIDMGGGVGSLCWVREACWLYLQTRMDCFFSVGSNDF